MVLVSLSRDGAMQARALALQGLRVVRGSSSRGGARGLAALVRAMRRDGADAAFAVDGPRGPRGVVKGGVVVAARAAGAVLVPMAGVVHRGIVLRAGVGPVRDRLAVHAGRRRARGPDRSANGGGRARRSGEIAGAPERRVLGMSRESPEGKAVVIDGVLRGPDEAKVSVYDRGFLFGDAVFEVLRTYGGAPSRWDEHFARLRRRRSGCSSSCRSIDATLRGEVEQRRSSRRATTSRTCASSSRGARVRWRSIPALAGRPLRVVLVEPVTAPPRRMYEAGVAAVTVRTQRSADGTAAAGAKVTNYLANLLAIREAKSQGRAGGAHRRRARGGRGGSDLERLRRQAADA